MYRHKICWSCALSPFLRTTMSISVLGLYDHNLETRPFRIPCSSSECRTAPDQDKTAAMAAAFLQRLQEANRASATCAQRGILFCYEKTSSLRDLYDNAIIRSKCKSMSISMSINVSIGTSVTAAPSLGVHSSVAIAVVACIH